MGLFKKKKKEEESRSVGAMAWRKLKANKLAMFGLLIIFLTVLIAALSPFFRPDPTKDANRSILEIGRLKPGAKVELLKVRHNAQIEDVPFYNKFFFGGEEIFHAYRPVYSYEFKDDYIQLEVYNGENQEKKGKFEKHNLADILYPLNNNQPIVFNEDDRTVTFTTLKGETKTEPIKDLQKRVLDENMAPQIFWLGTDGNGRDIVSRLMAGSVVSLLVGILSVFISLIIGITLGAIAGYYRGIWDDIIMWIINVVWSIPTLLLVIAISLAFGKDYTTVFLAVGLTMWVEVARIVRGQVMSVREKSYIEAGKSLGFRSGRIIFKHVLPNVMSPVIVISAANFASAILIEAGLSYLGIGTQPPTPSWGGMIADYKAYITTDMAYLPILPGLCIVFLVLSFMLLGNGIRDAFDMRSVNNVTSTSA